MGIKKKVQNILRRLLYKIVPELNDYFNNPNLDLFYVTNRIERSSLSEKAKLYSPYKLDNVQIGSYTYIGQNSNINFTDIGKFCSIGPNFSCGLGVHPTEGISTSPMFYARNLSNGMTFSAIDKFEERKKVIIGNDVWIGTNVIVLDGVRIGNGAVIGAGSVVTKDVPDYAISAGVPAKLIRYRFCPEFISEFNRVRWWDFDAEKLQEVEKDIFSPASFLKKYKTSP